MIRAVTPHKCCYANCPRPGVVFIGKNGNPESEWICDYHRDKWNADRDRFIFIADGLPSAMEELPITANKENPETQPPFRTGRAQSHPGADDPLDRGRMVYVDEIRITSSTQIAGSEAPTRDEVAKRFPKSVRELFPGRAAYFVRPIPEGAVARLHNRSRSGLLPAQF